MRAMMVLIAVVAVSGCGLIGYMPGNSRTVECKRVAADHSRCVETTIFHPSCNGSCRLEPIVP